MTRKVMVSGAIASHPLGGGGNAWAFLQWVLGFQRLGWEVFYVEELDPARCIDEAWAPSPFPTSANAQFFASTMNRLGLANNASLLSTRSPESIGLPPSEVDHLARGADLFINLSGRFHRRSTLDQVRCRIYVDLDPGFVQIWQEQYAVDMNLDGHDLFLTVGLNLGRPGCPLPTCGRLWRSTLPPVVLEQWDCAAPPGDRYTTVADWRGYSPVEWNGKWYGQKSEEFLKIVDLPSRVAAPLELCLAIHPEEPDLPRLKAAGWILSDPRAQVATIDSYRTFVRGSRGELTAVKNGYAAGRSGWFSDRSACYLASGRPVIVQDTGLGDHLPVGEGLLTFNDLEEAVRVVETVESDLERHSAAARTLARKHLDSDRVLSRIIEWAGF